MVDGTSRRPVGPAARLALAAVCAAAACGGGGSGGAKPDGGMSPPPSTCGDGQHQPGEMCDREGDCGLAARCTSACTCVPLDPRPAATSQVLIDADYRAGRIDEFHWLLYRALALYDDPRLDAAYDGVGPLGEDLALPGDVNDAWPRLADAEHAALQPFIVRPTDPGSIFSLGYQAPPDPGTAAAGDPCNTASPCAAWKSDDSAHFRVWSCGDDQAATRGFLSDEMEKYYTPMTAYLGEPAPDDADNDASGPKTDVYLVEPNQTRMRDGECKMIGSPKAAGQAFPAPPILKAVPSGQEISSGYLLVRADAAGATSTLVHEFFHILQLSHSRFAAERSWISESTAVWAEWHFDPMDAPSQVFPLFDGSAPGGDSFLARVGRPLDSNLVVQGFPESYEGFIWHYFAEAATGADSVARVWTGIAQGGKGGSGYDAYVDAVTPFAKHFREFAVRNLNNAAVLAAGLPTYRDLSGDFPEGTTIPSLEEQGLLSPPTTITGTVAIPKLAAHYVHFTVDSATNELTFDFTGVGPTDRSTVDLLLATSPDLTWKHVTVDGGKLRLCWDGVMGHDDHVYGAYVVLGNDAWKDDGPVTGSYKVTARSMCCPPGQTSCQKWMGSIQAVFTEMGMFSADQADPRSPGTRMLDVRDEQTWTLGTTRVMGTPAMPFDEVEATWRVRYTLTDTTTFTCGATDMSMDSADGSLPTTIAIGVTPDGQLQVTPATLPDMGFPISITGSTMECGGPALTGTGMSALPEDLDGLEAPSFVGGNPSPTDPNLFTGTYNLLHIVTPQPGGQDVQDEQVTWTLRRMP